MTWTIEVTFASNLLQSGFTDNAEASVNLATIAKALDVTISDLVTEV
jgi:hypothetical protein